jgi:glutamine---fructose-6-phosphate transaminase (isomerizing)
MCGIAGYVGRRAATPILLESLKRLEYRGYDSCGIAIVNDDDIFVRRVAGRIEQLEAIMNRQTAAASHFPTGTVGIGHTRWATHGRVDVQNAHPLASCDGSILVVHNGIIENADTLRSDLMAQGHTFTSETDSEVVAHYVEEQVKTGESIDRAVLSLPKVLTGSFGLLIAHKGSNELYVTRRGSPLVIGVGDHEFYPASDIPSFLPMTSRVLYLRENEVFAVNLDGVHLLEPGTDRRTMRVDLSRSQAVNLHASSSSKGNFDHFMVKEIVEQTETLSHLIRQEPEHLQAVVGTLRDADQIYLVGAGTSYHACLYAEYILAQSAGRSTRAVVSSEFEHRMRPITSKSVVVALSQSGETADTVAAVDLAVEAGAQVIAVTNTEESSLAHKANFVVPLESGLEIAVAATKSYTAQLGWGVLMNYGLQGKLEIGARELWRARDNLFNLTSDSAREHVRFQAQSLVDAKSVFLLGRGIHYVTALEAALKIKEVAGIRAEAFPGGEMKHGPLALIEEGTPVLLFYDSAGQHQAETAASELVSRGARAYTIGPKPLRVSVEHIRIDDTGISTPISQIVPMQILSYELARLRNLDPDHPRNLAKAVTVS